MSTDDEWVSGSDFDAAQERIAQLEADNKKLELLVLAAMTPQSNYLEERIAQLEAQLADVLKANQYHCGLLSESGERIRTLEAALREGRKWIGDGEYGDGLHRDHWTPKYNAVVDMIDACLTAALSAETPDREGGKP